MPIGTNLANLGNLIKAATSGFLQTVTGNKDTKKVAESEIRATEVKQDGKTAEHASTLPGLSDEIALSEEARNQSQATQLENLQTQNLQGGTQQETPQKADSAHVAGKQVSGPLAGQAGEEVQSAQATRTEEAALPPRDAPQAANAEGRPAAELQQLLQAWLQLDPKTITGLERFLAVEFSHYPEDYQIFMNMRMMNMLKQARRMMEEQKLAGLESEETTVADTPEGSRRAMVGAALMGYAFYKVLRKRKRLQEAFPFGEKGIHGEDNNPLSPFASLQEANRFLKEAEKELQRAMLQGLDNERIRLLARKVMDICVQVAEMQVDTPTNAQRSGARKQIVYA